MDTNNNCHYHCYIITYLLPLTTSREVVLLICVLICQTLTMASKWLNACDWLTANSTRIRALAGHTRAAHALARAPVSAGWGLNIEFEHGFGGKLRWLIRLQTGI